MQGKSLQNVNIVQKLDKIIIVFGVFECYNNLNIKFPEMQPGNKEEKNHGKSSKSGRI